ncbi:heparin-binding hemagglutinin [Nocardia higoensis]|uniref:Heparin-binding hemagglutinin n=1 Tax=Nocardia higoensis TaxID=228599 RepID=A0ABS0DHX4_9NOCA|nr:heparin-binding hemagglutinin [Nocardia higoensis]MBF6357483.1 heparin-binding hemagglutinin [Nocardia higoensis]
MTEKTVTVTKPLLAAVGAGDAVYAAAVDVVTQVRERAGSTADVTGRVGEARERIAHVPADVQAQFEALRERLSGLPGELPDDLAELREKLTPEELRKLAEEYYAKAMDLYAELAARGEETVERLRANDVVEQRIGRVETLYKDAASRAEDVVGKVNGLLGRPARTEEAAPIVDAEPVAAVVEAEVVDITPDVAPSPDTAPAPEATAATPKTAAKKAPAAKKAAPRKTAPKTV